MEYKKKINSEIKNNYKSNNLQNNKNKYSNKQNIIINNKNNILKSHPFKMVGNYKKSLSKTLNKSYTKINTQNNKNYYSKSLSSKKIKVNYANNNNLKNSNNIININEENKKNNNKIFVNTIKNREKKVECDNINDSYILNKNKLKKKNFNINLKDNNINKEHKEQLLNKISSKYILEGIFDYIYDRYFKLKLFEYSNLFQKKLHINIFNYQEKYLDKNGFDIIKYFSYIYNSSKNFSKDLLKDELEKDLLKINFEKKTLNKYI